MKKVMQYSIIFLTFAVIFLFAIGQIVIWQQYGFVLGVLVWIPFLAALAILGKIYPE